MTGLLDFWRWLRQIRPAWRVPSYQGAPTPPPAPPGYVQNIADRGEMFFRDSGPETAQRGTVLLLHGWLVEADINWAIAYTPLVTAGYRVIAPDHRGHGRGLRSFEKFTLEDAADDAAALVAQLRAGPVFAVGYSMGGAIAQLLARRHPQTVKGLVLGATALQFQNPPWVRWAWKLMSALQFGLRVFPRHVYELALQERPAQPPSLAHWVMAELQRGDPRMVADAGRQLAAYDARPWIVQLPQPIVVLVTARDRLVPPESQHEIATLAQDAEVIEVPGDHVATMGTPGLFTRALLAGLESLERRSSAVGASVGRLISAAGSFPVEGRA